jgi:molybdate transport system substrate-binding protein
MRQADHSHRHSWLSTSIVALCTVLVLALSACGSATTADPPPVSLTVFAAASLKDAFGKIGTQYHAAHPSVTTTFSFGGSDALALQITQGAPADVFASANITQMNVAVTGGDIDASTVQTFAHNRLVVILPKNNPANIQTLQDLAKPGIKIDLAAATVPVGQYAVAFLTKASADPTFSTGYKAAVLSNVVSYETDVKTVLSKISLGEADAGIVYTTDAQTATRTTTTVAIPDALNSIAVYPIAPIKASKASATAKDFVNYVASSDGQAVLASYGFIAGGTGPQYTPPAA